uniref:Cytochrome b6-f complex subunit petP n=1 Tax=Sarcopeltis skottsbergii TaxID=2765380 RepID=A0A7M1VIM6_SARSK|nr:cytochrome b6-f complex subunit petP [Sarcopeltis skottsbergii]
MIIKIGRHIKIKEMDSKNNLKIVHYIYKVGTVVGERIISYNYNVPIIEFEDYTRVWIFPKELKFISLVKIY